jgi:hypothetical protein
MRQILPFLAALALTPGIATGQNPHSTGFVVDGWELLSETADGTTFFRQTPQRSARPGDPACFGFGPAQRNTRRERRIVLR